MNPVKNNKNPVFLVDFLLFYLVLSTKFYLFVIWHSLQSGHEKCEIVHSGFFLFYVLMTLSGVVVSIPTYQFMEPGSNCGPGSK